MLSKTTKQTKCSFTGKEPSPKGLGKCAHLQAKGTILLGNDGNEWIVSVDKNGRKSWRKHSGDVRAKNNQKKLLSRTKPRSQKITEIVIGDPYYPGKGEVNLDISSAFLKVLRKSPKRMFYTDAQRSKMKNPDDGYVNAYVFGPDFPLNEFSYVGKHYQGAGGTWIVIKRGTGKQLSITFDIEKKLDEYEMRTRYRTVQRDKPGYTKMLQKLVSKDVVFHGEIHGGYGHHDGMKVYVHRNSSGEIDGLILNNNFFKMP